MIYESNFQKLWVWVFNFAIENVYVNGGAFLHFGLQILIICVVSFIATLGLSSPGKGVVLLHLPGFQNMAGV